MTREQREIIRKQIDALMRERLGGEPSPRGPRHQGNAPKEATEGEVAPGRRCPAHEHRARLRHERGEWRVLALDGERGINRRI